MREDNSERFQIGLISVRVEMSQWMAHEKKLKKFENSYFDVPLPDRQAAFAPRQWFYV